jgi:hypothetical protein
MYLHGNVKTSAAAEDLRDQLCQHYVEAVDEEVKEALQCVAFPCLR